MPFVSKEELDRLKGHKYWESNAKAWRDLYYEDRENNEATVERLNKRVANAERAEGNAMAAYDGLLAKTQDQVNAPDTRRETLEAVIKALDLRQYQTYGWAHADKPGHERFWDDIQLRLGELEAEKHAASVKAARERLKRDTDRGSRSWLDQLANGLAEATNTYNTAGTISTDKIATNKINVDGLSATTFTLSDGFTLGTEEGDEIKTAPKKDGKKGGKK